MSCTAPKYCSHWFYMDNAAVKWEFPSGKPIQYNAPVATGARTMHIMNMQNSVRACVSFQPLCCFDSCEWRGCGSQDKLVTSTKSLYRSVSLMLHACSYHTVGTTPNQQPCTLLPCLYAKVLSLGITSTKGTLERMHAQ